MNHLKSAFVWISAKSTMMQILIDQPHNKITIIIMIIFRETLNVRAACGSFFFLIINIIIIILIRANVLGEGEAIERKFLISHHTLFKWWRWEQKKNWQMFLNLFSFLFMFLICFIFINCIDFIFIFFLDFINIWSIFYATVYDP